MSVVDCYVSVSAKQASRRGLPFNQMLPRLSGLRCQIREALGDRDPLRLWRHNNRRWGPGTQSHSEEGNPETIPSEKPYSKGRKPAGGGRGGCLLILGRGYPHLLQHLLSVFCVMPGLRAAERGLQTRFPALAAMTHEAFSHAIAQCGAQPHMVPIIGGMPMSSVPRTKVP